MRFFRYFKWFSLFAYVWVAVGLSEIALMTWLTVDHHEASVVVTGHGARQVVLHHHKSNNVSASYATLDADDHGDHVLELPDQADALIAVPTAKFAKEVKADKLWLSVTPAILTQLHTVFSRVTLLTQQPPPPSRNHTLSFLRTILLLI